MSRIYLWVCLGGGIVLLSRLNDVDLVIRTWNLIPLTGEGICSELHISQWVVSPAFPADRPHTLA